MLGRIVLVPHVERRMVVHDEPPDRVRPLQVVLDPLLERGVRRIDVHVRVEHREVRVAHVERVVRLPGIAVARHRLEHVERRLRPDDGRGVARQGGTVTRQVHRRVVAQRVRVLCEVGHRPVGGLAVDVVVGDGRVERHRPHQRCPRARPRLVRVVHREEVPRVLVVEATLVHVVARVHHEVGHRLVGVVGRRAIADVPVRVIAERHKPDLRAARLARGEVPVEERLPVERHPVVDPLSEFQPVQHRNVVDPPLALAHVAALQRPRVDLRLAPAVVGQFVLGLDPVGLPRDHDRLLAVFQCARRSGLEVGKRGEHGPRLRPRGLVRASGLGGSLRAGGGGQEREEGEPARRLEHLAAADGRLRGVAGHTVGEHTGPPPGLIDP